MAVLKNPWFWCVVAAIAVLAASLLLYFYPFSYNSMHISTDAVRCRPYQFSMQHRQFQGSMLPSGAYTKFPHWDRDIELWIDDDVTVGRVARVFGVYTAGQGLIHYNWSQGYFSATAGMDGMQRSLWQHEIDIGFEYHPKRRQWSMYHAALIDHKSEKSKSIVLRELTSDDVTEVGDIVAPLMQSYPSHRATISLLIPDSLPWPQIAQDISYLLARCREQCHYRGLTIVSSINDKTQIQVLDLVNK